MKKLLIILIAFTTSTLFPMLTPRSATSLSEENERVRIEAACSQEVADMSHTALRDMTRFHARSTIALQQKVIGLLEAQQSSSSASAATASSQHTEDFWQDARQEFISTAKTQTIGFILSSIFKAIDKKLFPESK